ncbi:PREDICTED: uncharacterized protein LOC105362738 [Ceratosolen solmsi marchali]|uniref:Uncharacterized protein LOC105362738 n=1 Tax=Ceratosolen solmsi marchali TaxID=326594 RepID=A0AAJ7DW24_9HYME|nr:PREDICTED: uncharacterized protein LOC105362738 [Ceratosolen solmsi marchali]
MDSKVETKSEFDELTVEINKSDKTNVNNDNEPTNKKIKLFQSKDDVDDDIDDEEAAFNMNQNIPEEGFIYPLEMDASDMLQETDFDGYFPSVTERYLTPYYQMDVQKPVINWTERKIKYLENPSTELSLYNQILIFAIYLATMVQQPHFGGYIAIVLPNLKHLDKTRAKLLTEELYQEAIKKRKENKEKETNEIDKTDKINEEMDVSISQIVDQENIEINRTIEKNEVIDPNNDNIKSINTSDIPIESKNQSMDSNNEMDVIES